MTKTLIEFYSGEGLASPVARLRNYNKPNSYAVAEFESLRRESQSLRLTCIINSKELILNTHLSQSKRESTGQGKLSTVQGHINKTRRDQGDTRRSVPGGDRTGVTNTTCSPKVDRTSAQLTNNSVGVTLIKEV